MRLPLVLLHGFTGSPESFERVLAEPGLAERFEARRPALSGHDRAPFPATVASFEDEVTRLLGLVGGGKPLLCGYSLGARLALGLLVRAPERFRAALLIGVHPGLESDAARSERRSADARFVRLLREQGLASFLEEWEVQGVFAHQATLPAELGAWQRSQRSAHAPEGLARSLEVTGLSAMPNYFPALGRLALPVTLAAGELDHKFRELAERAARALPDARLQVAPQAGHNLPLERPDWVARTLLTLAEQAEGQRP